MRAVATAGAVLVAAGDGVTKRQAATWISRDGKSWLQPSQPPRFDGAAIHTLTSIAQGVIAVGGLNDDAALWTTLDGQTWMTIAGDAELQGAYMTSVVFRDRLVLGGATQERIPGTGSFIQRAFAWSDARGSQR